MPVKTKPCKFSFWASVLAAPAMVKYCHKLFMKLRF